MNRSAIVSITNVAAIALVAFGVHGCAHGSNVYSFAVIVGAFSICLPNTLGSDR